MNLKNTAQLVKAIQGLVWAAILIGLLMTVSYIIALLLAGLVTMFSSLEYDRVLTFTLTTAVILQLVFVFHNPVKKAGNNNGEK